jgi:hypothetical protein
MTGSLSVHAMLLNPPTAPVVDLEETPTQLEPWDDRQNEDSTYPAAPAVPGSWQNEDDIIKSVFKNHNNEAELDTKLNVAIGDIGKSVASKSDKIDEGAEITEREKTLAAAAAEKGAWNMRTTVGSWWSKALAADVDMKAAYTAIGRGYSAQRSFRDTWVTEALQVEKSHRLQRESLSYESTMSGIYYPAMRIA